jgi:hypothetical protein
MILVILQRGARRPLGLMPRRAPGQNAVAVLEPSGLSARGWAHDPDDPREDRLVVDGDICLARQVTAVITALDVVTPLDLPHVRAEDRSFVASEMTAFLRSWLQTAACPVLDPPTALALSGAAADRAVWSRAAAELAVPDRQTSRIPMARTRAVTVIADRVVGQAPEPAAATALSLTQAAGVTGARLVLTDDAHKPALCQAAPWWYTPAPAALQALLAYARELS